MRVLTPIEARVLCTLMEKARTVPDSYPLTLNSLLSGCNQKTSRDPLMEITEAQALEALNELRPLGLVIESSGGRTLRYEHNLQRALNIPEQAAVVLGVLTLRGPQTAAELRANSERWYRFLDVSSVEGFLQELELRSPEKGGALVTLLPRAPGAREQRWAHLLCGEAGLPTPTADYGQHPMHTEGGNHSLAARVAALEEEVARLREVSLDLAALRQQVRTLQTELGLTQHDEPL